MIWALFMYDSLPDVPEGCQLFSDKLMYRDFFMCNPTFYGHVMYPIFESLSYDDGYHNQVVKKFLKIKDPEKYLLFYTKHIDLQGKKKNIVVGYFKVGDIYQKEKTSFKDKIGFTSSETVLLSKKDCIEMPSNIKGVTVSWGRSSNNPEIERILQQLRITDKPNISHEYRDKTIEIMKRLTSLPGQKELITHCENCQVKSYCYWGKTSLNFKKRRLEGLYKFNDIEALLRRLSERVPATLNVFNPYRNSDILNNLREYLYYLKHHPSSVMLVGDSPGYRECRLTGIPFTNGRVIRKSPHKMFKEIGERIVIFKERAEPTGTILWNYLGQDKPVPILWNVFPFYSYKEDNPEIKRKPKSYEIRDGFSYLYMIIEIFNPKILCSVGQKSEYVLKKYFPKRETVSIVFPSAGGKKEFTAFMDRIMGPEVTGDAEKGGSVQPGAGDGDAIINEGIR